MRWVTESARGIYGADGVLQHVGGRVGMLLHGRVGAVAADPGHIKTHGRECAANVVVDFARNRGALLLDGGLQVFRQLREPALGAGQLGHGVFAHASGLVHLQRTRPDERPALA